MFSKAGTVIAWIVGVVGGIYGILGHFAAQDAAELRDRINEFQYEVSGDSLILTGGGGEFVRPDNIFITPVWGLASGIDSASLRGETYRAVVTPQNSDPERQTITLEGIFDRVCGVPENQERCEVARPVRIIVDAQLFGESMGADELPVS